MASLIVWIEKVAEAWPAGMVTEAGTMNFAGFDEVRLTATGTPPDGLRVTIPLPAGFFPSMNKVRSKDTDSEEPSSSVIWRSTGGASAAITPPTPARCAVMVTVRFPSTTLLSTMVIGTGTLWEPAGMETLDGRMICPAGEAVKLAEVADPTG